MRSVIVQGKPYVSVEDILNDNLSIEDLKELLAVNYSNTGRSRSLNVCSKKEKLEIIEKYKELIKVWEKEDAIERLCVQHRIRKAIIKQWVRGVHHEHS